VLGAWASGGLRRPAGAAPAAAAEREAAAVTREAPAAEREAEPAPGVPACAAPASLRERLRLTREALVGRLGSLLGARPLDRSALEDLEALLLGADLGVRTAEALLETVRREAAGGDAERVRGVLREAVLAKLRRVQPQETGAPAGKPVRGLFPSARPCLTEIGFSDVGKERS
jgi:fused signal recognition particle receptor